MLFVTIDLMWRLFNKRCRWAIKFVSPSEENITVESYDGDCCLIKTHTLKETFVPYFDMYHRMLDAQRGKDGFGFEKFIFEEGGVQQGYRYAPGTFKNLTPYYQACCLKQTLSPDHNILYKDGGFLVKKNEVALFTIAQMEMHRKYPPLENKHAMFSKVQSLLPL